MIIFKKLIMEALNMKTFATYLLILATTFSTAIGLGACQKKEGPVKHPADEVIPIEMEPVDREI